MKKLIFLPFLFLTTALFAQEPAPSTFYYKAKFEGVNTEEKATEVINVLKTVFRTTSTYNSSTSQFEFNSKMSINQTGFSRLMSGEGYTVESFEKTEVKDQSQTSSTTVPTTTTSPTPVKTETAKSGTTTNKGSGK